MSVYDEDIIPPVEPPIETDPYDPFVNGDAARTRCPGTNMRNVFVFRNATKRCQAPITATHSVIQIKPHDCFRKFSIYTVPENWNVIHQACSSNPQLVETNKVQIGYTKNVNPKCKKPDIFVLVAKSQKRCGTSPFRNRDFPMQGVIAAACILSNKRMAQDLTMRRFCMVPKLFVDQRITRIRRICGKFAPLTYKLDKLCRIFPQTTEDFKVTYTGNLGRCGASTESVDFDSFTFNRICTSYRLDTVNLPNSYGTIMPRSTIFACRRSEVFIQTLEMLRGVCGNQKNFNSNERTHYIYTCRYESKFAPQGFLMHRGRCGVIVRANAPDLIFGRIWGGRDPFVVQARLSGRMMGRIRDQ